MRPEVFGAERARKRGRRLDVSDRRAGRLLLVHPLPRSNATTLQIALHFVRVFSAAEGKLAPAVSEDAAAFLSRRTWRVNDLAARVHAAVIANQGSLITAADLSGPPEREPESSE